MDDRVKPAAKSLGAKFLDVVTWTWDKNRRWLNAKIKKGERIFDIGREKGRYYGPYSVYYKEVQYMVKKGFERVFTGKWITGENGKKFRLYEWIK